jgi:hypothetical protein
MTKKKVIAKKGDLTGPRLVEIRFGFDLLDGNNDSQVAYVTAARCHGRLDLRVTLRGSVEDIDFLPAAFIGQLQGALELVEGRVSVEDLVEQEE